MESSAIDENLLKELRPGERVLWWGRPSEKHRVIKVRSSQRLLSPLFGVLLLVLLTWIDASTFPLWHNVGLSSLLLLLVFNILLFALAFTFFFTFFNLQFNKTLRHTLYAITNQRALLLTVVPGKSYGVISYAKSEIGTISRHEGKGGWGDLTFGTPRPMRLGGKTVLSSVRFVGVPDVRQVEWIMVQTFKMEEKSSEQV